MAGFWGSHLGLVDLELTKDAAGWKVAKFATDLRPIYDRVDRKVVPKVDSEALIIAAVQADHDATLKYVREPVGTTAVPIYSYYSLVADDASVKLVAEAQAWYVADLLKTTPYKDLPLLSAAAPFKAGGRGGPNYFTEIKPGPLAIKDMADIYIYPNTIRAVKVTGAQVREWLERSAGIYNQIDVAKGGEQDIVNAKFPAYNFDVIAGVQYKSIRRKPRATTMTASSSRRTRIASRICRITASRWPTIRCSWLRPTIIARAAAVISRVPTAPPLFSTRPISRATRSCATSSSARKCRRKPTARGPW